VITFTMPAAAINGCNNRAGFFRLQIDCQPTEGLLVANGENLTVLASSSQILTEQMLHKTADGGKTAVPGNRGVPASRLDMIQEREHGVRPDIIQAEVGNGFMPLICKE
jgi:hypothetical protein